MKNTRTTSHNSQQKTISQLKKAIKRGDPAGFNEVFKQFCQTHQKEKDRIELLTNKSIPAAGITESDKNNPKPTPQTTELISLLNPFIHTSILSSGLADNTDWTAPWNSIISYAPGIFYELAPTTFVYYGVKDKEIYFPLLYYISSSVTREQGNKKAIDVIVSRAITALYKKDKMSALTMFKALNVGRDREQLKEESRPENDLTYLYTTYLDDQVKNIFKQFMNCLISDIANNGLTRQGADKISKQLREVYGYISPNLVLQRTLDDILKTMPYQELDPGNRSLMVSKSIDIGEIIRYLITMQLHIKPSLQGDIQQSLNMELHAEQEKIEKFKSELLDESLNECMNLNMMHHKESNKKQDAIQTLNKLEKLIGTHHDDKNNSEHLAEKTEELKQENIKLEKKYKKSLDKKQEKLSQTQEALKKSNQQKNNTKRQYEELRKQNNEMKSLAKTTQSRLKYTTGALEESQKELDDTKASFKENQEELREMQRKYKLLASENNKLKKETSDKKRYKKNMQQQAKVISQLQNQISLLQREINILIDKAEKNAASLGQVKCLNLALAQENKALQKELLDLRSSQQSVEKELKQTTLLLEKKNKENKEYEKRIKQNEAIDKFLNETVSDSPNSHKNKENTTLSTQEHSIQTEECDFNTASMLLPTVAETSSSPNQLIVIDLPRLDLNSLLPGSVSNNFYQLIRNLDKRFEMIFYGSGLPKDISPYSKEKPADFDVLFVFKSENTQSNIKNIRDQLFNMMLKSGFQRENFETPSNLAENHRYRNYRIHYVDNNNNGIDFTLYPGSIEEFLRNQPLSTAALRIQSAESDTTAARPTPVHAYADVKYQWAKATHYIHESLKKKKPTIDIVNRGWFEIKRDPSDIETKRGIFKKVLLLIKWLSLATHVNEYDTSSEVILEFFTLLSHLDIGHLNNPKNQQLLKSKLGLSEQPYSNTSQQPYIEAMRNFINISLKLRHQCCDLDFELLDWFTKSLESDNKVAKLDPNAPAYNPKAAELHTNNIGL